MTSKFLFSFSKDNNLENMKNYFPNISYDIGIRKSSHDFLPQKQNKKYCENTKI